MRKFGFLISMIFLSSCSLNNYSYHEYGVYKNNEARLLSFDGKDTTYNYYLNYFMSASISNLDVLSLCEISKGASLKINDYNTDNFISRDVVDNVPSGQSTYKLVIENGNYSNTYYLEVFHSEKIKVNYYDNDELVFSDDALSGLEYTIDRKFAKKGYTFSGIYDQYDHNYYSKILYNDTNLFVKYDSNSYLCTVDDDTNYFTATYEQKYTIPVLKRTGYKFLGHKEYQNGDYVTDIYGNSFDIYRWDYSKKFYSIYEPFVYSLNVVGVEHFNLTDAPIEYFYNDDITLEYSIDDCYRLTGFQIYSNGEYCKTIDSTKFTYSKLILTACYENMVIKPIVEEVSFNINIYYANFIYKMFNEILVDGEAYSDYKYKYRFGETHTFSVSLNEGYSFKGWFIGETLISSETTFKYTYTSSNITLSLAAYKPFNIDVKCDEDRGFVSGGGYFEATPYQNFHTYITATAYKGYKFYCWERDGIYVSTENPYRITSIDSHTYTAVFIKNIYSNVKLFDFGSYPQYKVEDTQTLFELKRIVPSFEHSESELEPCDWKIISGTNLYYKDFMFLNAKYRAVYKYGEISFFKFTPISWKFSGGDTMQCYKIIFALPYSLNSESTNYRGLFPFSYIYYWLNNVFLYEAFNEDELKQLNDFNYKVTDSDNTVTSYLTKFYPMSEMRDSTEYKKMIYDGDYNHCCEGYDSESDTTYIYQYTGVSTTSHIKTRVPTTSVYGVNVYLSINYKAFTEMGEIYGI